MPEGLKGFQIGNQFNKTNVGRKASNDTKEKLSNSLKKHFKDNPNSNCGFQKGHKTFSKKGRFRKGQIPWNKGIPFSKEVRKKMGRKKLKDKICPACENVFSPYFNRQKCCSRECFKVHMSKKMTGKRHSIFSKEKIKIARLRQITPIEDTSIEVKLQNSLKRLGIPFEKHKIMDEIYHKYRCDIFISPDIVIECDGDYWHNYPNGNRIDKIRTTEMKNKGYSVLRFWERDIKNNIKQCEKKILEATI